MCDINKLKLLKNLVMFRVKGEYYKIYKKVCLSFPQLSFVRLLGKDKNKTNEIKNTYKNNILHYILFSLLSLVIGTCLSFK